MSGLPKYGASYYLPAEDGDVIHDRLRDLRPTAVPDEEEQL